MNRPAIYVFFYIRVEFWDSLRKPKKSRICKKKSGCTFADPIFSVLNVEC